MIEKAEDGDGDLLGHLMLTARKVAKEQGLEKVQYPTMDFSCAVILRQSNSGLQSGH